MDNQQPIDDLDQYPEGVHFADITHGTFGQATSPTESVVAGGDLPAKFPGVDFSKPKNMFDDPAYSVPPEEHSFAASAKEFFQQAGGLGGLTHKAVTAAKEASEESTIAQFQGREPAPAGAFPSEAQYDTAVAALSASEAARERAGAYHVEGVKDALGMLVGSGISAATDPIAAMLAVPSMGVSEWGLAGLRAIGLDQVVTHIAEAAFPKAAPIVGETAAHVVAGAPGSAVFGAGYEAARQEIEIDAGRQAALDKANILYAAAINGALGAGLASLPGLARLAMRLRGEPVPGMPEPMPAPEVAAQPQVAAAESSKEAPEIAQKPAFEGQIAEGAQPGAATLRAMTPEEEAEITRKTPASPVADTAAAGGPESGEMFIRRGEAREPGWEGRQIASRQALPQEAETIQGPRQPVPQEEAAALNRNKAMADIAASLGRKFTLDRRMSAGALGTFKPASGVIRVRFPGDIEAFSHELGHAIDQILSNDPASKGAWAALRTVRPNEILPLDYNATVTGRAPTIEEGIAEFLRRVITNPAAAEEAAPDTFAAFKAITDKMPQVKAALDASAKLSETNIGLSPMQRAVSIIAKPQPTGWAAVRRGFEEQGIAPKLAHYAARFYGWAVNPSIHMARFASALKDAAFEKTGKPLGIEFADDPLLLYRQMPRVLQSVAVAVKSGIRPYGQFLAKPVSPGLEEGLRIAMDGAILRATTPGDKLGDDFKAYLVQRMAKWRWQDFEDEKINTQPIPGSREDNIQSIADFEATYPRFSMAAEKVFAYSHALLQKEVDAGIFDRAIGQELLDSGRDYVPGYRDISSVAATSAGKGGGGIANTLQSGVEKKFKGSTLDILDPIESLIKKTIHVERAIAVNDVWKNLSRLAKAGGEFAGKFFEEVPNDELTAMRASIDDMIASKIRDNGGSAIDIETAKRALDPYFQDDRMATIFGSKETNARGEPIVFWMENGKRKTATLGDTEIGRKLFDLMTASSSSEREMLFQYMHVMSHAFTSSVTGVPGYALMAAIRDNMVRMISTPYISFGNRIPGWQDLTGALEVLADGSIARYLGGKSDIVENLRQMAETAPGFREAIAAGGGIRSGAASHAAFALRKGQSELNAIKIGMSPSQRVREEAKIADGFIGGARVTAVAANEALNEFVKIAESGETISRLGVSRGVFNYLKGNGVDDRNAIAMALHAGRDVLDYDIAPRGTRLLAKVIPFLRAGITGWDAVNRSLVGRPVGAVMQAARRGGYANLDAEQKLILQSAWKQWLTAGATIYTGKLAYDYSSQTEAYRRASQYIKDHYHIIQLWMNPDGSPQVLNIRKPMDLAGAIGNVYEHYNEAVKREAPHVAWEVAKGFASDATPREFGSPSELMESAFPIKLPFELYFGQKFGFGGAPSRPIVPDHLANRPLDEQTTAMTSWLAKEIGHYLGASPMTVDHVIQGGGSSAQAGSDIATAVFDHNPNVTAKDAIIRMFTGTVYRALKSSPTDENLVDAMMARQAGSYTREVNGYKDRVRAGDDAGASAIYDGANDSAKALIMLQDGHFHAADKQLHPMEREATIAEIVHSMEQNLKDSKVEITQRYPKGEAHDFIKLNDEQTRQVYGRLNTILIEEQRNALTINGEPGYEGFKVTDTKPLVDALREVSPAVADEFEKREEKAHIVPALGVAAVWPEVKERLLQDGNLASVADLRMQAQFYEPKQIGAIH